MSRTTTGNKRRLSVTINTEYYDKLPYYTEGPVGALLSRVLSQTLGKHCEQFSRCGAV